jgi:hypothetical protein
MTWESYLSGSRATTDVATPMASEDAVVVRSRNSDLISRFSQQCSEHTLNRQFLAWNEVRITGVFRLQKCPAIFQNVSFQSALAVNQCCDNLPMSRLRPVLQNHNVATANVPANHRIPHDSKREGPACWLETNRLNIHCDTPLGFLLGLGTEPRRDCSEDRDFYNCGLTCGFGILNKAKRTRLACVRFQETLSLDRLQMTSGGSVAAETESFRNFSQGRTGSPSLKVFPDKVENILLSLGQAVHILSMWIVLAKHDVKLGMASGAQPINPKPTRPSRRLGCQAVPATANFTTNNAIGLP